MLYICLQHSQLCAKELICLLWTAIDQHRGFAWCNMISRLFQRIIVGFLLLLYTQKCKEGKFTPNQQYFSTYLQQYFSIQIYYFILEVQAVQNFCLPSNIKELESNFTAGARRDFLCELSLLLVCLNKLLYIAIHFFENRERLVNIQLHFCFLNTFSVNYFKGGGVVPGLGTVLVMDCGTLSFISSTHSLGKKPTWRKQKNETGCFCL